MRREVTARPGVFPRRRPFLVTGLACGFLGLLLATLEACERKSPTEASVPPDPSATFSRVQREVLTPSCALSGCHAGSSPVLGLSLEAGRSYRLLVGVPSVETSLLRVSPGLPNDSYLVVKLRADGAILGGRMPPGAPLAASQTSLVTDWIRRGAPND